MKKLLLLSVCLIMAGADFAQSPVLWGTTQTGGTKSGGTIFTINPDGSDFKTQFNFTPPAGFTPKGKLLQASNGKIYGTCYNGGFNASCTIFCYDPTTNVYADVYDFDILQGDFPESGLVEAPNGRFYGVTSSGGLMGLGQGVLYSFNPASNIYSDLYDFDVSRGVEPFSAPLYFNGKLYGTTISGGSHGAGVIYSYDIATRKYTDLVDFDRTDGRTPYGSLMIAGNGKMYGMTSQGGNDGQGVIFSFNPATNIYSKLYDFQTLTGGIPMGELLEANGKLYGCARFEGNLKGGVIFSFDLNTNSYRDLYDFDPLTASHPVGSLTVDDNNKLYGAASDGGAYSSGALFSFDILSETFSILHTFDISNGSAPACGLTMLTTNIEVSFPQLTSTGKLLVYPNPVNDVLNIDFDGSDLSEIILYDVSSREVLRKSFTLKASVNTETLEGGVYVYELRNNNAIISKGRVVKLEN